MIIGIFLACKNDTNNASNVTKSDTTEIFFYDTVYDFGKIVAGEQVVYSFRFKNIGKAPLIISQVRTSCGCTASEYTDRPVKPDSEGYIKVTFNSSGRYGNQNKIITVFANTKPSQHTLLLKGFVENNQ